MPQFTSEFIFWFGLRSLGLVLAIIVLPITIVLQLGDSKNASAFAGIAFSLLINSYGIYILFAKKKDSRSEHCPASSRTVFDIICFVSFVIAGGIFVHERANRARKPGEDLFDGKDIPALVIYFGLALLHFVLTIYDCVETLKKDQLEDEESSTTPQSAKVVEAVVGESHLATRTQRVLS